jgi:hypothetical protein
MPVFFLAKTLRRQWMLAKKSFVWDETFRVLASLREHRFVIVCTSLCHYERGNLVTNSDHLFGLLRRTSLHVRSGGLAMTKRVILGVRPEK